MTHSTRSGYEASPEEMQAAELDPRWQAAARLHERFCACRSFKGAAGFAIFLCTGCGHNRSRHYRDVDGIARCAPFPSAVVVFRPPRGAGE